jgi:hypothetical protein
MIETLASRIIFISSNVYHTVLEASIREKIDLFFEA